MTRIIYYSDYIKLKSLLDRFWKNHDPTQVDRQDDFMGAQYRSVIFGENEEQMEIAFQSKNERKNEFDQDIETNININKIFYFAEEEHQQYLAKNPFGLDDFM